ncbi:MAG: hypothetical protein E6227_26840, partial [Klebsiella oxytoca]|nr:hypothetical protein [Klebsiella oxytoca]
KIIALFLLFVMFSSLTAFADDNFIDAEIIVEEVNSFVEENEDGVFDITQDFLIDNLSSTLENNITWYREIEPNDTVDQAMTMKRNNDSYIATINSDLSVVHKASGELSSLNDVDWFKVYLYANETSIYPNDNNINIHAYNPGTYSAIAGNLTFDIYNENGNLINSFNYSPDRKIFQAEIPEDGFYYIRLHSENSIVEEVKSYNFSIGSPIYSKKSYTHTFKSVIDTGVNEQSQVALNIGANSFEKDAVVYYLEIGGGNTSHPSVRKFKNDRRPSWTSAKHQGFYWEYKVPSSLLENGSFNFAQRWEFLYDASYDYPKEPLRFNPIVLFKYVHPVLK